MTSIQILSGISGFSVLSYVIFKRIRPRFPINVECWFCQKKCKVPYFNYNCWDCPNCQQYNGFTKDGDYNKPIPSQHSEEMNFSGNITGNRLKKSESFNSRSVLCSKCSRNQLLKMKQLSHFEPSHEDRFDEEADAYKAHLESVYALCGSCEHSTIREIQHQDSILRQRVAASEVTFPFNRSPRRNSPSSTHSSTIISTPQINENLPFMETSINTEQNSQFENSSFLDHPSFIVPALLRFFSAIIAVLLLFSTLHHLLQRSSLELHSPSLFYYLTPVHLHSLAVLLVGTVMWIIAVFLNGNHNPILVDAFSSLIWVLFLLLHLPFITQRLHQNDMCLIRMFVSLFNVFICLLAVFSRRQRLLPKFFIVKRSRSCSSSPTHSILSGGVNSSQTNQFHKQISPSLSSKSYNYSPTNSTDLNFNNNSSTAGINESNLGTRRRISPCSDAASAFSSVSSTRLRANHDSRLSSNDTTSTAMADNSTTQNYPDLSSHKFDSNTLGQFDRSLTLGTASLASSNHPSKSRFWTYSTHLSTAPSTPKSASFTGSRFDLPAKSLISPARFKFNYKDTDHTTTNFVTSSDTKKNAVHSSKGPSIFGTGTKAAQLFTSSGFDQVTNSNRIIGNSVAEKNSCFNKGVSLYSDEFVDEEVDNDDSSEPSTSVCAVGTTTPQITEHKSKLAPNFLLFLNPKMLLLSSVIMNIVFAVFYFYNRSKFYDLISFVLNYFL